MHTIVVCLRGTRNLEVARYTYATSSLAIIGRIEVMEEWIRKNKMGVLVSAIFMT